MRRRLLAASVLVLALSACLHDHTVDCGDHLCPAETACTLDGCARPEQLVACDGKPDREACSTPAIADGACKGEVCLPIICGDGTSVGPEVCDDGNQRAADGCSADCASTEVCGNGTVDPVRGEQCDRGLAGLSGDGCSSTCGLEVATWTDITPHPPAPRMEQAMTYDARRQRVVMFGGRDMLALAETWEWDGSVWHARTPATSPSARTAAGLAYDPGRGVAVLFGGTGAAILRDTWEWDGVTWALRAPATSPPARTRFAFAYDPVSARLVLFGGTSDQLAPLGDTWTYDGTTWTELALGTHPPAGEAQLALDPTSGTLVLVSSARETWIFTGSAWTKQTVTTPQLGIGYSLSRGPGGAILFGGFYGNSDLRNTSFRWASGAWTQVSPSSPPPGRYQHATTYDEAHQALVLFGGTTELQRLGDTTLLNTSSWSVPPAPGAPAGGSGPALVYERAQGSLLVFGGSFRNETWRFSDVWTQPKPLASPSLRQAATMVAIGDRTLLFGGLGLEAGCGCLTALADSWEWSGTAWTQLAPAQSPPARDGAGAAYDARRARAVLFGGEDAGGTPLDDTWEWDGTTWIALHPPHHPTARTGAIVGYDRARGQVILFGGSDAVGVRGDTWAWDGTDWTQHLPAVSPPARTLATGSYHDGRGTLVLVGGFAAGFQALADTWEWDGTTWSLIDVASPLPPRGAAASAYDPVRHQLVVLGGSTATTSLPDLWALRFGDDADSCVESDTDGDALAGCADPDCWARCTPTCAVGEMCEPSAARCGDGACSALEDHHLCPGDCP